MSSIPKIIHQTWKSRDLPDNYKNYSNSWKDKHPDWEYCFYDDIDCENFVKEFFPQFLEIYNSMEKPVMKADMFRYLVVYKYGGVYADIDTLCLKSLNDLLDDSQMIVGIDLDFNNKLLRFSPMYKYYKKNNINKQYAQYIFMSTIKNPILLEVVENISQNNLDSNQHINVFLKTGPGIFTKIVDKYVKKKYPIKVLDIKAFNGVDNILERYIWGNNKTDPSSYIKHNEDASWKDKNSIIYTFITILIISLFISIIVFFIYGIIYYFKCKKRGRKCLNKKIYCRIKIILLILSNITFLILLIILINFFIQDRAYWPF